MALENELTEWLHGHKLHRIKNVHGSAQLALEAWGRGQLWYGHPIRLGKHKIHVYGCYMRDWSKVYVEFTDRAIFVVKPPR